MLRCFRSRQDEGREESVCILSNVDYNGVGPLFGVKIKSMSEPASLSTRRVLKGII